MLAISIKAFTIVKSEFSQTKRKYLVQTISKFSLDADDFTVSLLAALSRRELMHIDMSSGYTPAACAAKAFTWLRETHGDHFNFRFHVFPSQTWGFENWAIALERCAVRQLLEYTGDDRFSYALNHGNLQEVACGSIAATWTCNGQGIGEFFAIWDGAASVYLAEQRQLAIQTQ